VYQLTIFIKQADLKGVLVRMTTNILLAEQELAPTNTIVGEAK
jgi:hypothetical protein